MTALGGPAHLVRRFFWSLRPPALDPTAEARLVDALALAEAALFDRMSDTDRRHAVAGARAVIDQLGADVDDEVVVAAALHDVGKVAADLGTFGRVVATIVGWILGETRVDEWADLDEDPADALDDPVRSWRRRIGRYVRHDVIGAAALRRAGSSHLAVVWAGGHHGTDVVGVDEGVLTALRRADDV